MKHSIDGDRVFIRLEKGEEVFASLEKLATEHGWKAAHMSGIGALTDVELGCYELDKKDYIRKTFSETYELLSLDGNICRKDGKPLCHIHTVLSDHHFACFGGHMFKGTCAVTVEINLRLFDADITREHDEEIGLSLLEFCPV